MIDFLVFILYVRKAWLQILVRHLPMAHSYLYLLCICAVIVVAQVIFSQESFKEFEDDEPVTFVTYEFFEHELQTTPVVKGTR